EDQGIASHCEPRTLVLKRPVATAQEYKHVVVRTDHRNVQSAIVIKIAHSDRLIIDFTGIYGNVNRLLEQAVAKTQINLDSREADALDSKVRAAIAIKIHDDDGGGKGTRANVSLVNKGPIAPARKDGHAEAVKTANRQVEPAILVEVSRKDPVRGI